jgi:hypothetical protein
MAIIGHSIHVTVESLTTLNMPRPLYGCRWNDGAPLRPSHPMAPLRWCQSHSQLHRKTVISSWSLRGLP